MVSEGEGGEAARYLKRVDDNIVEISNLSLNYIPHLSNAELNYVA